MAIPKMIINEKKYVEELLQSSTPPDYKEVTANMLIMYLTKYYYKEEKDITLAEITEKVCNRMNDFHYDVVYYQEYKAKERIKKIFNDLQSGKLSVLRDIDYIPIYQSEYDIIMSCKEDQKKKVLFTLYVLARFTNKFGWVYLSESDIYKLANTTKTKDNLLAYMIQDGLIKCTKKVDDLKVGVNLSEDTNEPIIFKVFTMNHIGNQLMASIKDGYKMCENGCGKLIKLIGDGRPSKYCKSCKKKMHTLQQAEYRKRLE